MHPNGAQSSVVPSGLRRTWSSRHVAGLGVHFRDTGSHAKLAAQSRSSAQASAQRALAPHANGEQLVSAFTHVPAPLHVELVAVAPWQVGGPHVVPLAWTAQAPPAVQSPVVPHDDGSVVGQRPFGSGPAFTGSQTPSTPWPFLAAEHAWQVMLHG